MSKLVITKDVPHPSGDVRSYIIAQMELPDDAEVVAIIMEATASAIQEYFERQRNK